MSVPAVRCAGSPEDGWSCESDGDQAVFAHIPRVDVHLWRCGHVHLVTDIVVFDAQLQTAGGAAGPDPTRAGRQMRSGQVRRPDGQTIRGELLPVGTDVL